MELRHMREWIKSAYINQVTKKPQPAWAAKVDKMPDNQVIRVYKDLVERGRIRGA